MRFTSSISNQPRGPQRFAHQLSCVSFTPITSNTTDCTHRLTEAGIGYRTTNHPVVSASGSLCPPLLLRYHGQTLVALTPPTGRHCMSSPWLKWRYQGSHKHCRTQATLPGPVQANASLPMEQPFTYNLDPMVYMCQDVAASPPPGGTNDLEFAWARRPTQSGASYV